jgi:uncharacterized repeat protein (TIGR01451 family)
MAVTRHLPLIGMKRNRYMRNLIRNSFLMTGLTLALALSGTGALAADAGRVTLPGHYLGVVSQLPVKAQLAGDTTLHLAIGLALRNQAALTNLLQEVYDPASPNYHKFLTPAQFADQFSPTEKDYQAVVAFAKQHGLTVTTTHSNRLLVDVSGKSSDVEQAFQIKLHTYHHPSENRDFYAPDSEPSVPAGLVVQDISGLDSYRRPQAHYQARPLTQSADVTSQAHIPKLPVPTAKHNTGSGPFGTYVGNDFRTAYIPGSSLNGAIQSVALVQFDGYNASDIQAYETLAGRTNIPLQNVLLDGFSGAPTGNGGEVEVSLDIEMAVSMAPALAKIIVYEGDPNNFHPNDVLNKIATDDLANQVSCSWGWTGGPSATTDAIFQQMALQGQSFFVAAGDSCAYPAGTVDNPFGFGTPADSAYVTSVGGTTLTMTPTASAKISETVWNWGIEYGADGIGSSGGISTYYKIPYWQTNVSMTACQGSTTYRNFPDVALTADNVLVIADGGVEYQVGGTSCASPLWAAFTSLINQQGTNSGRGAIGFINPAIYHIAGISTYTNCFNDITTGNNTWSGSTNLFYAVTNYDLCTGLGTPNGTNLINALTTGANYNLALHISPPPPPYGTTLSAVNGGSPNGTWALFVMDDSPTLFGGMISNGWFITLTLANPVGLVADLGVTMSVSPTNALPGSNVVYSLTVTNYGYCTSSNVLVSVTLPSGASLLSSNATLANQILVEGSQVSWSVTTNGLTNTAGASLTLTVQMPAAAGTVEATAIAQASTPDPNPDNNSASALVNVAYPPAPQLSAVLGGSGGGFQLSITNAPGQSVIIQASTNLLSWIPILTNTEPFTFTNFDATNFAHRFYRAVTGP